MIVGCIVVSDVGVVIGGVSCSVGVLECMCPCIVGEQGDNWDRSESFNCAGSHHVCSVVLAGVMYADDVSVLSFVSTDMDSCSAGILHPRKVFSPFNLL